MSAVPMDSAGSMPCARTPDERTQSPMRPRLPRYVLNDLPAPEPMDWDDLRDALLMEALSVGSSFSAAGRMAGVNKDQAAARFKRLRKNMGWQAS